MAEAFGKVGNGESAGQLPNLRLRQPQKEPQPSVAVANEAPGSEPSPTCPECGLTKVWKDGIRHTRRGEIQRYVCRSCGFRFSQTTAELEKKFDVLNQLCGASNAVGELGPASMGACDLSLKPALNEPPFPFGEDIRPHSIGTNTPTVGQNLYSFYSNSRNCRVCAAKPKGAKNLAAEAVGALAEEKAVSEKRAAGATKLGEAEIKGKILELVWCMKKQGYSEETIRLHISALRTLHERGANLYDPESFKEVIAKQRWSDVRRRNVINAYTRFLKQNGLQWEKPKCKVAQKLPFIPMEKELDVLIAGSGKKTSTFLQLLKETAIRAGEAMRLKWTDVDFERRIITLNNPEKNSKPRIWKVSEKLIGMLNNLPTNDQKVFGNTTYYSLKQTLQQTRKRLAVKLQNPRLEKITFHTFRHWKATVLYHQTKDPYYVKEFLGHKSIKNTEIYITIERAIFGESSDDEFTVKVASKPEEIKALLEVGFEYVCEKDGLLFFRKRK